MIDRKEIQEAAASKFNPTVGGLANTTERIAFEKGVDWFKHAIWHNRDEEPTEDGLVLQHLSCDGKEYIRAYNWLQMKKELLNTERGNEPHKKKLTSGAVMFGQETATLTTGVISAIYYLQNDRRKTETDVRGRMPRQRLPAA